MDMKLMNMAIAWKLIRKIYQPYFHILIIVKIIIQLNLRYKIIYLSYKFDHFEFEKFILYSI